MPLCGVERSVSARTTHLKGSAYQVGLAMGRFLGPRLARNIARYVVARTAGDVDLDLTGWRAGALGWLSDLPERFRDELYGLAAGAELPLQRVAEWVYLEVVLDAACSGVIAMLGEQVWVARNNDSFAPDMWGYVTIREIEGRIPTITFGMEGDVFTPTGINQARLWLHYNYLPAWDAPAGEGAHLPCYAWIVEALETCRGLLDVEELLRMSERNGAMLLFAVDGKNGASAVYECGCTDFVKRQLVGKWMVATNHAINHPNAPAAAGDTPGSTVARYRRLVELVPHLVARDTRGAPVDDLVAVLADEQIERRTGEVATVYANVACPTTGELWYTFGGYPAASCGNWQRLPWPWAQSEGPSLL